MDPDTTFSPIEFKVIDAQQNQTLQFEANQIEQLRWNYWHIDQLFDASMASLSTPLLLHKETIWCETNKTLISIIF